MGLHIRHGCVHLPDCRVVLFVDEADAFLRKRSEVCVYMYMFVCTVCRWVFWVRGGWSQGSVKKTSRIEYRLSLVSTPWSENCGLKTESMCEHFP